MLRKKNTCPPSKTHKCTTDTLHTCMHWPGCMLQTQRSCTCTGSWTSGKYRHFLHTGLQHCTHVPATVTLPHFSFSLLNLWWNICWLVCITNKMNAIHTYENKKLTHLMPTAGLENSPHSAGISSCDDCFSFWFWLLRSRKRDTADYL